PCPAVDFMLGIEILPLDRAQQIRHLVGAVGERISLRMFLNLEIEGVASRVVRSEEHTSELQSRGHLVCRLLLEKKNDYFFSHQDCPFQASFALPQLTSAGPIQRYSRVRSRRFTRDYRHLYHLLDLLLLPYCLLD